MTKKTDEERNEGIMVVAEAEEKARKKAEREQMRAEHQAKERAKIDRLKDVINRLMETI